MTTQADRQLKTGAHPSQERLSGFLDADAVDLGSSEWMDISNHLEQCEACRERLRALHMVDERVGQAMRVPAGLADRIEFAVTGIPLV